MKVKVSIKSIFAVLFVVYVSILSYSLYQASSFFKDYHEQQANRTIQGLTQIQLINSLIQESWNLRVYFHSGSGMLGSETTGLTFSRVDGLLNSLLADDQFPDREGLKRVRDAFWDIRDLSERTMSGASESVLMEVEKPFRLIRDGLKELELEALGRMKDAHETSEGVLDNILGLILFFWILMVLFGVFVVVVIIRFVYTQVGGEPVQIKEITKLMTEGDLSYDFPVQAKGILASISQLQNTMRDVADKAQRIASGDFRVEVVPKSDNDQLGSSLAKMTQTLISLDQVSGEIARGSFSTRLEMKSENDLISRSINQMSTNLERNERVNQQQNWLKDGLNKLSAELSGDQSLGQIASRGISFIGRYLKAGKGVIYQADTEKGELRLLSSFAFTERDHLSNVYLFGQGVPGQVALEKKPILLKAFRNDEAPIMTGTTSSLPLNTYTFPLVYEGELMGVVELASNQPFTEIELDFLNQSNEVIASGVFSALQRSKISDLLEQSQAAQREAEEKTRQVQESNLRLEEQQKQIQEQSMNLQRSNAQLEEQQQQLQQQSEELQQTNAQLEEQQQQLLQQTEELRQGNDHLRQAKEELDLKAQDLEMSNKYKSDFLATMSHELRTPLNSIILLSKMMQKNERGNFGGDDIKRAKVIHSAGEELLRLINDILDISKIEAGKTSLSISRFSSESLMGEIRQMFSSQVNAKGLELVIEDDWQGPITQDRDKISQILRNFVANALKFTRTGTISIKMNRSQDAEKPLKISVRDTGIGIPPEKHKMIFDAFQQVDSSISREFGGTGLGLTISQKLCALLHGSIHLWSEEGKGSEFTLLLPAEMTADEAPSLLGPMQSTRQGRSGIKEVSEAFADDRKSIQSDDKVILIVEDDSSFAEIVALVIRSMKMKVLHASTAESGLRLVQQFRVNGIILDLVLPDMNGVDFMRRLKSLSGLRHIPVQIISGHEKNPELIRMGALDYLQKPVDQEQIQNAIQGILNFSNKNPKDLLIVEDNQGHREALISMIESRDIRVKGVENEEEARTELMKGIYDAVIIDLGLQSGSGMGICQFAREKNIKAPIIVYTGKQLTAEEEKNIKRCADRIIIKTVHSENRLMDELMLFLHQTQAKPGLEPAVPGDLSAKGKRLTGKTILVVDDDIKNVFVLSTALEEHGARVLDSQNGQEAIRILLANPVDLVLMDIMMPVMDGYTAMRKIREEATIQHIPMIALTAKALKEDREKCIAAGANDYLSKPVDYDMLIGLVEAWCQKKN